MHLVFATIFVVGGTAITSQLEQVLLPWPKSCGASVFVVRASLVCFLKWVLTSTDHGGYVEDSLPLGSVSEVEYLRSNSCSNTCCLLDGITCVRFSRFENVHSRASATQLHHLLVL